MYIWRKEEAVRAHDGLSPFSASLLFFWVPLFLLDVGSLVSSILSLCRCVHVVVCVRLRLSLCRLIF